MTDSTKPAVGWLLARVYAVALGVTVTIAITVAVVGAGEARAGLQWTFPGVPATFASAVSIFTTNAPKIVGALAATAIVQAPWIGVTAERVQLGRSWRLRRALCDLVGLFTVVQNLAILGIGIGAYGQRMLLAVLPHGPIELLAFSLAAVVYLRARRGPLSLRPTIALSAASLLTLAVAAVLEAFLPI